MPSGRPEDSFQDSVARPRSTCAAGPFPIGEGQDQSRRVNGLGRRQSKHVKLQANETTTADKQLLAVRRVDVL